MSQPNYAGRPRVLVGLSGSRASLAALAFAADEASRRGAVLHVVIVSEPWPPLRAPYSPVETTGPRGDVVDVVAAGSAVAAIAKNITVVRQRIIGRAPAVLITAAQGADLLVLGRTTRDGFLGPTARACVSHAPCPVTLVDRDWHRDSAAARPAQSLATA